MKQLPALGALVLGSVTLFGFTSQQSSQSNSLPAVIDQPIQDDIDTTLQECVVTFTNGRQITGILMDSSEDAVVLRINGIDTTYQRSKIANTRFLPSVESRFTQFRSALADDDIDGRLLLVDWLRDRRAYAMAVRELDSILEISPNHPQAQLLKTWLSQHLKLVQNRSTKEQQASKKTRTPAKSDIPLLTPEQINLIRVYEIDLDDPPKLKVDKSTIQKLMQESPDMFPVNEQDRERLLDGSDLDRLKLLFRFKARDLYDEIQVFEDPQTFKDFKKFVAGNTGWLINGCATAQCHGGQEAGNLQLVGSRANSPESLYTNFMILDQFQLKDGSPLMNYTDPERSPLVQYGMVRSRSLSPHPEVDAANIGRDWRPIFRSTKAKNFNRTIEWIRTLYTPRPDYGVPNPLAIAPSTTEQESTAPESSVPESTGTPIQPESDPGSTTQSP
ncbi:MAG: hypothetical protein AB8C13_04925 [Phycisphaerales bacterium]